MKITVIFYFFISTIFNIKFNDFGTNCDTVYFNFVEIQKVY